MIFFLDSLKSLGSSESKNATLEVLTTLLKEEAMRRYEISPVIDWELKVVTVRHQMPSTGSYKCLTVN